MDGMTGHGLNAKHIFEQITLVICQRTKGRASAVGRKDCSGDSGGGARRKRSEWIRSLELFVISKVYFFGMWSEDWVLI